MKPVSHNFEFVGGNLALDFVNTVHSGMDTLSEPRSITQWAHDAGLGTVSGLRLNSDLSELRDALTDVAAALADERMISPRTIKLLNEMLSRYPGRAMLRAVNGAFVKETTFDVHKLEDIAGPIAAAAADLLASPNRDRVKRCPGCDMYFVDESRNRTRTWCSMKSCGNRAKVAAYYQRSRT